MQINYSKIIYFILFLFTLGIQGTMYGQGNAVANLKITLIDSSNKQPIPFATAAVVGTKIVAQGDEFGIIQFKNIPAGLQSVKIIASGYKTATIQVNGNLSDIRVSMESLDLQVEEVIVSSTRTNSRIEDLPIKVEVLGEEDMNEESSIVPSGVGSILGDLSVITIQRTNPVNGNDAVRMQGLDYKYTQILRDGLPLFDGFSSSLGVLSIPPLDLKQVEIIKGSASTLYGGGAIGGLINFISRKPADSPTATFVLNRSSLNESNLNLFITKKYKHIGTTVFGGANFKKAFDVNGDGFSDVPEENHLMIRPRVFLQNYKKWEGDFGATFTSDFRMGGDMEAIKKGTDSNHTYLFKEKVFRATLDGNLSYKFTDNKILTLKATGSLFDRKLNYSGFEFAARQLVTYSEANYLWKNTNHTLVTGVNQIADVFTIIGGSPVPFNNYTYNTIAAFGNDIIQLNKTFSLDLGMRVDYHSRYKAFYLPSLGLFIKPAKDLSLRFRYGTGYKVPNLFNSSQPTDYSSLVNIQNSVAAEKSQGFNTDVNYALVLWEKLAIDVNQALYYTNIQNPTYLIKNALGSNYIQNVGKQVYSIGTDTYVRLKYEEIQLYLGYNFTRARLQGNGTDMNLPFNPNQKFAVTLAYEIEKKWRFGVEAAYNSQQYIQNNVSVPNYWFFAGMVEKKFKFGSLVLNTENIGDYRQAKISPLYTGDRKNPTFSSIWGPVEGRVFNLSLKIVI